MLTYLLVILIIVFVLLTVTTTSTTSSTYEGFTHETGSNSHGSNSHGGSGTKMGHMGGNLSTSRQNDTLENAINNNSPMRPNQQNYDSGKLTSILNNQPNTLTPIQTTNVNQMNQMNQINQNKQTNQPIIPPTQTNNMNRQNDKHTEQPRKIMNQESNQELNQESNQEMNKIRFQTPTRLEMELPYEQPANEIPKYSNDMVKSPTENNTNNTNNKNTFTDSNSKIKNIIKKSAELSFLALDNNKEPVSALKSSNYAMAYVSALQEIYTNDQIQSATNIDLSQFKNELLKIQNTITANIKNTCSSSESDKQYLLKIINNV